MTRQDDCSGGSFLPDYPMTWVQLWWYKIGRLASFSSFKPHKHYGSVGFEPQIFAATATARYILITSYC